MKKLLTIAGSDPSGGAGIQADLKTFSALGCYGMSVITALTAQNTQGVKSIYEVSPEFIGEQLEAVFSDIDVDGVKIGMLHKVEVIEAVANVLKKYLSDEGCNSLPLQGGGLGWGCHCKDLALVLDPVMVAKSGDRLLKTEAIEALKELLIPLSNIITPNIPETYELLGYEADTKTVAKELLKLGTQAVVVKGGHLEGDECIDTLLTGDKFYEFQNSRIDTPHTHGTGCTFSSAITSFLAQGNSIEYSVEMANKYIHSAIESGKYLKIGKGRGPVNHFFNSSAT